MKEYKVKHAKENSDSITETSHANDSIAFFFTPYDSTRNWINFLKYIISISLFLSHSLTFSLPLSSSLFLSLSAERWNYKATPSKL